MCEMVAGYFVSWRVGWTFHLGVAVGCKSVQTQNALGLEFIEELI
jgi:hypothetical protein